MTALEFLNSKGAKWDIDNYSNMWVPGSKLIPLLEEFAKDDAQHRYEAAIKFIAGRAHPLMGISEALRIAAGLEEGGEG